MKEPTRVVVHRAVLDRMHKVYKDKNAAYGNSFALVRGRYPEAIMVRLLDKVNRLDTLTRRGTEVPPGDESFEDTLLDLANYAVMELVERYLDKTRKGEEVSGDADAKER